ncbi:hypothetical protein LEMLEM_LOCUS19666 [Lemmus lemmus]
MAGTTKWPSHYKPGLIRTNKDEQTTREPAWD